MDKDLLVAPHPLSNINITNYFDENSRFDGVFSRNNYPETKDGGYVINAHNDKSKTTHGPHYLLTKI